MSLKEFWFGLVNSIPAVASQVCLALPCNLGTTQLTAPVGARTLVNFGYVCRNFGLSVWNPPSLFFGMAGAGDLVLELHFYMT